MELAQTEKDQLLTRVLRLVTLVGFFAYVPGVWLAVADAVWAVAVVNTVVYCAVAAASFAPAVPFRWKLVMIIAGTWIVGTVLLFSVGVLGAAYVWLVAAIVFAAIFGDSRGVASVIGVTAAMLLVYAWAIARGVQSFGATPELILVNGASLLVVSMSIALLVNLLIQRLENALRREQSLTGKLSVEVRAGEELLREVHHRVNNNMQLVLSLMNLEAPDRVPSRVRVLAAVNALLHRDRTTMSAELPEIVAAVRALLEPAPETVVIVPSPVSPEVSPRLAASTAIPFGLYLYECGQALVERGISVAFQWSVSNGEIRFRIVAVDCNGDPIPATDELRDAMATIEHSLAARMVEGPLRFPSGQEMLQELFIPLT